MMQAHPFTPPGRATAPRPADAKCIARSGVIVRVLAPPEAGRKPRSASAPEPPSTLSYASVWSSTTSYMSQLLSHFARVPTFASPEQVLREARDKERELQNAKAPLDVSAFLAPVGIYELKQLRKLSSLTALTYFMNLVTPRRLQRMHGLDLVVTSRACDIRPYEHNRTAEEVGADGDGMAVSFEEAHDVYSSLKRTGPGASGGSVREAVAASNIVTMDRELSYQTVSGSSYDGPAAGGSGGPSWPLPPAVSSSGQQQQQQQQKQAGASTSGGAALVPVLSTPEALGRMLRSPAEVVSAKLAEAAVAASAAAAASPLGVAAESFYAGLASLPIPGGLVGANNRASNALMSAGSTAAAGSAAAASSSASASAPRVNPADPGAPNASGKATAASIAAMAAAELRSRRSGGGMAAVSASGMLSPGGYPTASAAAAAATVASDGALVASSSASGSSSLTFSASSTFACPSEWFVVDEASSHTRIFVIQGSDTLDHWKLNLTFDPVVFEEPGLGIKVHRGVYEAALVLYDRFLPLVYEHLESSPFSKIAFTGHSIGGSLATLLMLMYRNRGVLPPHSVATVYTFGAPAVFCQSRTPDTGHVHGNGCGPSTDNSRSGSPGAPSAAASVPPPSAEPSVWSLDSGASVDGGGVGGLNGMSGEDSQAVALPPGILRPPTSAATKRASLGPAASPASTTCACGVDMLLSRLELPPHIVRNVVMARDVVPRAFACDYSLVADILKGWGPSFKEHCCLNRDGRKHLYYFVGRMCILQPDSWHSFTASDPEHPMLPPGPELYALAEPDDAAAAAAHFPSLSSLLARKTPAASAASASSAGTPQPHLPRLQPLQPQRPSARSVVEAVWELMDCPHPLETLADPGAYLASGTISRYHNPEHYTKALGRITHLKRQAERRHGSEAAAGSVGSIIRRGGTARSSRNIVSFGGGSSSRRAAAAAAPAAAGGFEGDVALGGGYEGGEGMAVWDSSDALDLHLGDFMAAASASAGRAADPHACG